MERFIGMDHHPSTCTFGVLNARGKRLRSDVVETNGQVLREYIKLVPRPRYLCFEEGGQSAWLYEILSPLTDRTVVIGSNEKRSGPKDDKRDAFELAEKLRINDLPLRVYKPAGQYTKLRALVKTYSKMVEDHVRAQVRVKALYRSRGIQTPGTAVYAEKSRAEWLDKLPHALQQSARLHYQELDALRGLYREAREALAVEAREHAAVRRLRTAPGLGLIRSAQTVAVVVSPHRFRTKRQLWSYAGLGIVMRSSSDWVQQQDGWVKAPVAKTRGLNRNHNRMLKDVFKGAAMAASRSDHQLRAYYERQLANGVKPNLAHLSVARKLAAIVLAMWKNEEDYNPAKG